MLGNYVTIACRNLLRNKGYACINLVGLSVGIAACLLIGMYVRNELSYDDFHAKADRIYRVTLEYQRGEQSGGSLIHSGALAPALEREFPSISKSVRVSSRWGRSVLVKRGEATFYENNLFLVDPAFFDVFSFTLLEGNPETVLAQPYSAVITEEAAQKYFGDENPIGQTIRARAYGEMHQLRITGIAANVPPNSHIHFDILVSFNTLRSTMPTPEQLESWNYTAHYTYVLLKEGAGPADFVDNQAHFLATYQKRAYQAMQQMADVKIGYQLQPITRIHLYSHFEREIGPNSDIRYVYIFGSLAFLLLIVACINYMNLATAQSAKRAREVGIRKVVGASRRQLVRQFMGESAIICVLALVMALALTQAVLPSFNAFTGLSLNFSLVPGSGWVLLLVIGITVALVSASYPAFHLSAFGPMHVLKGRLQTGTAGSRFRKGLVVFQFAVAIGLIAATILIHRQLNYMQAMRLGFNKEHVVAIDTRSASGAYKSLKQELLQHSSISGVTASTEPLPTTGEVDASLIPEGVDETEWREQMDITINMMGVDADFTDVMEIPLLEGRDFRVGPQTQDVTPVLINETAARVLGWEEPVGKSFPCCFSPPPLVIGVIQDFHYQTLKHRIQPLVLHVTPWGPRHVMARVEPGNLSGTLDIIRSKWQQISDAPFIYTFLDSRFDEVYKEERRMASLFAGFAFLAIIIACLGLFGLAAYAAERRTREIGIRKILGASVLSLVALLAKNFLKLVGIAFFIAVPVAYFVMQHWLRDFAYRIELGLRVFVLAGVLAVFIALAAVSYQAVRAALADPVEAVRSE